MGAVLPFERMFGFGELMHQAAFEFVLDKVSHLPPRRKVLEYGGRDINGTVRPLFDTPEYLSIDIRGGRGVDLVADAATYTHPYKVDTVICCEVLEHSPKWPQIVMAAGRSLDPNSGVLILTCACNPRAPHSGHDGGEVMQGEYYGNVDPMVLTQALDAAGFVKYEIDCDEKAGDLRVIAWKHVDE